jgi:lipoprotein-releasing system permease protein
MLDFKNFQSQSLSFYLLKKLVLSDRSGSLIRRTARLSFLAIVLSVSVFFIVMFVMNGMNQNIRSRLFSLDPHLSMEIENNKPQIEKATEIIKAETASKFTAINYTKYDLIIRTIDGQFRGSQVVGYDQDGLSFWKNRLVDLRKKENKWSNVVERDFVLNKHEIALGIDLARLLGVLEGDEVTLIPAETLLMSQLEAPQFQKVLVKYILTTDLYDLDSKLVLFNHQNSLQIFSQSLSKESGFHVWLDTTKGSGIVYSMVDQVKSKYLEQIEDLKIETWKEKNSDLFFALFLEKTIIGLFLGLAGVVASSSILTVLVLIMSQKKNDIAILKTIGLSKKATLYLFAKIGLIISGAAIGLGTILGVGVSFYIEKFPLKILPNIYYDSSIPAFVDMKMVFVVVGVSLLLSVVGCYFPARATLKIQPAVLLKTR